jgi:hypothetical protein
MKGLDPGEGQLIIANLQQILFDSQRPHGIHGKAMQSNVITGYSE